MTTCICYYWSRVGANQDFQTGNWCTVGSFTAESSDASWIQKGCSEVPEQVGSSTVLTLQVPYKLPRSLQKTDRPAPEQHRENKRRNDHQMLLPSQSGASGGGSVAISGGLRPLGIWRREGCCMMNHWVRVSSSMSRFYAVCIYQLEQRRVLSVFPLHMYRCEARVTYTRYDPVPDNSRACMPLGLNKTTGRAGVTSTGVLFQEAETGQKRFDKGHTTSLRI